MSQTFTRRHLLRGAASAALLSAGLTPALAANREAGRFRTRPGAAKQSLAPGVHLLRNTNERPSLLYLPPNYQPNTPLPLFVMFHGASGNGGRTLEQERAAADEQGVILLCPSSRQGTWDAIRGDFERDFNVVDELLQETFDACAVDASHLAIGGFSDGATYGLSLGLLNGDLFTHVIAHSPGFIISDAWQGKPQVYVSHGRQDQVLPFDRCGAVIAARLEKEEYPLRFDVFDGGHVASPELRSAALAWLKEG
ncbi:MAG: hypothetical protein LBE21_03475 [Pseudomonadales bacterium]|jgi:predicted esterase|nr:hypothetical protein [Pseudomonadales bacterium]